MAGQQQINTLDINSLYQKNLKELKNQIELDYNFLKFRVGKGKDRNKQIHAQLLENILCTDDCTIQTWLDKKLRGVLDENVKVTNLYSMEQEKTDTNIYNYYQNNQVWQEVDW